MDGDQAIFGFVQGNSPSGEINYKLLIPCSLCLGVLDWGIAIVSDNLARVKEIKSKKVRQ